MKNGRSENKPAPAAWSSTSLCAHPAGGAGLGSVVRHLSPSPTCRPAVSPNVVERTGAQPARPHAAAQNPRASRYAIRGIQRAGPWPPGASLTFRRRRRGTGTGCQDLKTNSESHLLSQGVQRTPGQVNGRCRRKRAKWKLRSDRTRGIGQGVD